MIYPFNASDVWNAIKNVGNKTAKALSKLWDGKGDKWWEDVGLFIPRVIGTAIIGVVSIVSTAVVICVGAVTAGIMGGAYQVGRGLVKIGQGIINLNGEQCKQGLKDVAIGATKLVVGAATVLGVGLAVASGVGAPAVAAITAVAHVPLIGTIATAGHTAIVGTLSTIGGVTSSLSVAIPAITGAIPVVPVAIAAASVTAFAVFTKTVRKIGTFFTKKSTESSRSQETIPLTTKNKPIIDQTEETKFKDTVGFSAGFNKNKSEDTITTAPATSSTRRKPTV